MPRLNGEGPWGQGPGSGRGLGFCSGGRAWGNRGFGRRFLSSKNEMAALKEEEKMLEKELDMIREEKAALEKEEK